MSEKLTRSGIAYDLKFSPYKQAVEYENTTIEYIFSSEFYRVKFMEKLEKNRETITQSLTKKFGFTVKNEILSDLKLYMMTEKRGFLLYENGKAIECKNTIKLDGQTLI